MISIVDERPAGGQSGVLRNRVVGRVFAYPQGRHHITKKRAYALFPGSWIKNSLEINSSAKFIHGPMLLRQEQHVGMPRIQACRLIIDIGCIKEERRRLCPPELIGEIELLSVFDVEWLIIIAKAGDRFASVVQRQSGGMALILVEH